MFLSIRGKLPMNFEIHRALEFLARLVLCAPVGFVFRAKIVLGLTCVVSGFGDV